MAREIHQINFDLKALQAALEKELILKALVVTRFDKSEAAIILNIDRKTLYNKLDKYKITKHDYMRYDTRENPGV
jgi:DNA-binding NtrC family response regulator